MHCKRFIVGTHDETSWYFMTNCLCSLQAENELEPDRPKYRRGLAPRGTLVIMR